MEKTDKELAVELASAYISAWFSRVTTQMRPLSGDDMKNILTEAYSAVLSLGK